MDSLVLTRGRTFKQFFILVRLVSEQFQLEKNFESCMSRPCRVVDSDKTAELVLKKTKAFTALFIEIKGRWRYWRYEQISDNSTVTVSVRHVKEAWTRDSELARDLFDTYMDDNNHLESIYEQSRETPGVVGPADQ